MKIKLKAVNESGLMYLRHGIGDHINAGDVVEVEVKISSLKIKSNNYWLDVDEGASVAIVEDPIAQSPNQTKSLTLTETLAHLKGLIG